MTKVEREELAAIRSDEAQERENERAEAAESVRREWAQRNGNDSGFDPYWYL